MAVHERPHAHEGPCRIGVGFVAGITAKPSNEWNAARVLREAVLWAEGLEYLAVEIALAEAVLARWDATAHPVFKVMPLSELHVTVTAEELEAVRVLVDEAVEYWETNGYADEDPEQFPEDVWVGWAGRFHSATLRNCGVQMWGDKAKEGAPS
jgi:hypothetical protein